MNNFTINGIVMCISSGFIIIFEWIAELMKKPEWSSIFLCDFGYDMWITISDKIPIASTQEKFDYIVFQLPLWQLLLTIGIICIITGSIVKQ